jgi:hypothetical protein
MASVTPRMLYLRGRTLVPTGRCGQKNLSPAGNQNPALQPTARRYTD